MSAHPLTLPPVRLLPGDALARQALAAPLFDRALRLARWAGPERAVDGTGALLDGELAAAAEELGLSGEDAQADAGQAWSVAVDIGLLALEIDEEAEESTPPGEAAGRAVPGEAYAAVAAAGSPGAPAGVDPYELLDLWLCAAECVLVDATAPDEERLFGGADGDGEAVTAQDADPLAAMAAVDDVERAAEEDAELLDAALVNLYALSALEPGLSEGVGEDADEDAGRHRDTVADDGFVPLPVLAASLVVPEEVEPPTDEVLEEVTEVMLWLDAAFGMLESTGMVEYTPMDEALVQEADGTGDGPGDAGVDDIAGYGAVRLTPLGVHGVRERLADAGAHVPVIGDLADATADDLLAALVSYPDHAVRAETELWAVGRKQADAARELLAAASGDGEDAPARRLVCQRVLGLLGAEAGSAVREVLDDVRLGGLARVWLTEQGAQDVPAPTTDMVYWLTIDTLAAQLTAEGDPERLAALFGELIVRNEEFFAGAWSVEHPATAAVLEAVGRLHPDRPTAKAARKAAFKARSRDNSR